jgi:hypothetical protein
MRHDVFRFVAERPVQATTPDDRTLVVTKAFRDPPRETALHRALRDAAKTGSYADLRDATDAHFESARFRAHLDGGGAILDKLDAALLEDPTPKFDALVDAVSAASDGRSPTTVAETAEFAQLRDDIADSVLALVAVKSDVEALNAGALRLMQLAGLVEWLARHEDDDPLPRTDVILRAAESIVTLPADMFPLPAETRVSRGAATASSRYAATAAHAGDAGAYNGPVDAQARIAARTPDAERAVRELVNIAGHPSDDGRLGDLHWEALSGTTRALLSHLGVSVGSALVGAVDAVERADLTLLDDVPGLTPFTRLPQAEIEPRLPIPALPPGFVPLPKPPVVPIGPAKASAGAATLAVGVAELHAVRRIQVDYELGELAHVENVLGTEHRMRRHRFETESEVETETQTETETETTRDLATSDRMELDTEMASESQSSLDVEAHMGMEASYGGTLSVSADFGVSSSTSTSNSHRVATRAAKETTERTATRIRNRTTERRRARTRTAMVETNEHGFENDNPEHIVGVYRWIDRVEHLQLYTYGMRTLLELNVPEPAAFYRYQDLVNAASKLPPAPPKFEYLGGPITPATVTQWSYGVLANQFHAQGLEPPPPALVSVGGSWSETAQDPQQRRSFYAAIKETMAVPAGYRALSFRAHLHQSQWLAPQQQPSGSADSVATVSTSGPGGPSRLSVGDLVANLPAALSSSVSGTFTTFVNGNVPVGLLAQATTGYSLTVEMLCGVTPEATTNWQLRTYDRLLSSWQAMQSEWAAAVQRLASREGVVIGGRNPGEGMQIIRNEMRRWILELMTGRDSVGNSGMAVPDPVDASPPDLDPARAAEIGRIVSFVEQAFEWPLMSWRFHPYFWATPDRWTDLLAETDPDPVFQSFLRAGAARAVVPVREGWEQQVGTFLRTGAVWGGGGAPQVDESLFLSLAGEAVEPERGEKVGKPWTVRLPTSSVALDVPDLVLPSVTYSE